MDYDQAVKNDDIFLANQRGWNKMDMLRVNPICT